MKRGVLLALGRDDAKQLFGQRGDEAILSFAQSLAKRLAGSDSRCDCGTHWQALHQCFSNGSLDQDGGEPPLNQVILGGRPLANDGVDCVMLVRPDMVPHVASALVELGPGGFLDRFERYLGASDLPIEPLCELFRATCDFYKDAAEQRAAVLFVTVEE